MFSLFGNGRILIIKSAHHFSIAVLVDEWNEWGLVGGYFAAPCSPKEKHYAVSLIGAAYYYLWVYIDNECLYLMVVCQIVISCSHFLIYE